MPGKQGRLAQGLPTPDVLPSTIRNRALSGVAGIWTTSRTFTGAEPELARFARVTPKFFDLLGVRAALGRTFSSADAGGTPVILTHGVFERPFGGNRALFGQALKIQGARNQLVAVLPAGFQLYFAPDANIPADVQGFDLFENGIAANRDQLYIRLIGRLRTGVTLAQAQRDLDRVSAELRSAYTDYATDDLHFTVSGMQADAAREVRAALTILFAGAVCVLLICCVNVVSLLMARATARQ